jgi:hypothetical protein
MAILKMLVLSTAGMALWIAAFEAPAFETATHAAMTSEAFAQSHLTRTPLTSDVTRDLGILDPSFLSYKSYMDIGSSPIIRNHNTIQELVFKDLKTTDLAVPDAYTLTGWAMQGVIREDDNSTETPQCRPDDPIDMRCSDEPGGVFNRVFGHFFDPQNDRALTTVGVVPLASRAVDWALSPTAVVSLGHQNHFKISDAREAMWRALTLTAADLNGGFNANVWPTNWPDATADDLRRAYWATTFRALGDVVHLIQDMAQPQHTRNDFHSGLACLPGNTVCFAGHDSFFEKYLNARTLRKGQFSLDESFFSPPATGDARFTNAKQLVYEGYIKPAFNSYADYFATGRLGNNLTGKGLANYSNRGFYTFGTNIRSFAAMGSYPYPDPYGDGLVPEVVTGGALQDMTETVIPGSLTVLTGTVHDTLNPAMDAPGVKLSSVGMWDQFLKLKDGSSSWTLNYYNYDAQAALLVPRAVAYSAGLIDYFFRGQMAISLPDSGVYAIVDHADFSGEGVSPTDKNGFKGFDKIRLKLINTTPDIQAPDGLRYSQDMGVGTLAAVAKFHRNLCYVDDLSGQAGAAGIDIDACRSVTEEIVVSQFQLVTSVPLQPVGSQGTPKEYEFTFDQAIPINARDLYLQVVFRGVLGQEQDAVVVATRDISEPTYLSVSNSLDYLDIDNQLHTFQEVLDSIGLLQKVVCGLSCFNPDGQVANVWTFRRELNGPNGVVATINSLPVRRFSRLAVLTNAGGDQIVSATGAYNCPGTETPYPPDTTQWNFSSNGAPSPVQSPFRRVRGVYGWYDVTCVWRGDGKEPDPALFQDARMTMGPLENLHPMKFTQLDIPVMPQ